MKKGTKINKIGGATLIVIITYSIILYIYFENTIPGAGLGLPIAQSLFMFQLLIIVLIGLIGFSLICKEIYKGNKMRKDIDILAKSLIEKIRNYFSDRIEEIEEGSYVPTYEQVKEMPEFSEVNRETFRNARRKWYLYNYGISFFKFNAQFEKIK